MALDEDRLIAKSYEQAAEILVACPRQDRRIGDLVAVEMQDRQHSAVASRIEKLRRMPGRRKRASLSLTVADHAGYNEVRIVERGAEGVDQRISEFAAFVDRTGGLRGHVAGYASRKGKLSEQLAHAIGILRDVGIDLAVCPLKIGVRDHSRPPWPGPHT